MLHLMPLPSTRTSSTTAYHDAKATAGPSATPRRSSSGTAALITDSLRDAYAAAQSAVSSVPTLVGNTLRDAYAAALAAEKEAAAGGSAAALPAFVVDTLREAYAASHSADNRIPAEIADRLRHVMKVAQAAQSPTGSPRDQQQYAAVRSSAAPSAFAAASKVPLTTPLGLGELPSHPSDASLLRPLPTTSSAGNFAGFSNHRPSSGGPSRRESGSPRSAARQSAQDLAAAAAGSKPGLSPRKLNLEDILPRGGASSRQPSAAPAPAAVTSSPSTSASSSISAASLAAKPSPVSPFNGMRFDSDFPAAPRMQLDFHSTEEETAGQAPVTVSTLASTSMGVDSVRASFAAADSLRQSYAAGTPASAASTPRRGVRYGGAAAGHSAATTPRTSAVFASIRIADDRDLAAHTPRPVAHHTTTSLGINAFSTADSLTNAQAPRQLQPDPNASELPVPSAQTWSSGSRLQAFSPQPAVSPRVSRDFSYARSGVKGAAADGNVRSGRSADMSVGSHAWIQARQEKLAQMASNVMQQR